MSLRVLIADDDAVQVADFRTHLDGVETRMVMSGLECLDQLRRWRPDILVIDADLPWGSGLGVLAVMREDPEIAPLPVLLLASEPAGLAWESMGWRDYALMTKPVPPATLARVIFTLAGSGWADVHARSSPSEPPALATPRRGA